MDGTHPGVPPPESSCARCVLATLTTDTLLGLSRNGPIVLFVYVALWNDRRWSISWFVCGEQINHRLRQMIDLRDTDKSRYFAITEYNNCFVIPSSSLFFYPISSGSEAICHFHARAIARRRKARFPLRMCRILFAAKHSWTALRMSRPLFVGSYLQFTWWALGQWKKREKFASNDNNIYSLI